MNWDQLREECELAHGCSEVAVRSSRGDRRKQRKIEEKQAKLRKVTDLLQGYLSSHPNATREQAYKSVIAILAPFFLQWLIGAFEKMVLNWLLNRLYPNPQ